jgi:hypothetical protein
MVVNVRSDCRMFAGLQVRRQLSKPRCAERNAVRDHFQLIQSNPMRNRPFRIRVELFKTVDRGWAVRSQQRIPKGTYICE